MRVTVEVPEYTLALAQDCAWQRFSARRHARRS